MTTYSVTSISLPGTAAAGAGAATGRTTLAGGGGTPAGGSGGDDATRAIAGRGLPERDYT